MSSAISDPVGFFILIVCIVYVFWRLGILSKLATITAQFGSRARGNRCRELAQNFSALWSAEDKTILFQPALAEYYGDLRGWQVHKVGILGAAGETVIFLDESGHELLKLAFSEMRWMEARWGRSPALFKNCSPIQIQCEEPEGWRIYTFYVEGAGNLFPVLRKMGVRMVENRVGEVLAHPDNRELSLKVFLQDIYGQWDQGVVKTIYLAPDRLLLDWKESIHYSQIRGLAVIANWEAAMSLLRIDYDSGEDAPRIIGLSFFLSSQADEWGGVLQRLTDVPCEHLEGRKKKTESDDSPLET